MKTSPTRGSAGFTLIELMIVVTLLAILMAVGLPSFKQLMRNYQVRVVAESVQNGLQRARAEGVARNARVQFVLVPATPSWSVDYVVKPVSTDPPLDAWTKTEGGQNAAITGVAADLATAATTITFNQLGQVIANADASVTLRQVNLSATGSNQALRVLIGAGGNAKVCDPSLPATNVRSCPVGLF